MDYKNHWCADCSDEVDGDWTWELELAELAELGRVQQARENEGATGPSAETVEKTVDDLKEIMKDLETT